MSCSSKTAHKPVQQSRQLVLRAYCPKYILYAYKGNRHCGVLEFFGSSPHNCVQTLVSDITLTVMHILLFSVCFDFEENKSELSEPFFDKNLEKQTQFSFKRTLGLKYSY